jgi:dienelactone hydrolase
MVKLYKPWMALLCLSMTILFNPNAILAQAHTPRVIPINSNCGGYYEYLPEGYQSNGAPYPLIIFLHGQGSSGNGNSELNKLIEFGLPKVIADGQFPNSFSVNSRTFRFIVISPQFQNWPVAADVEAVVNYAVNTYNVDETRIYITGMSMGGGVTWDYAGNSPAFASKLAAIVPVCGASAPMEAKADNMANADLPVWATHNQNDPQVPVSNTDGYVSLINNNAPPPSPLAKKTIFPVTGHDAWTTTYNPTWRENGLSIYEWMLQYQRTAAAPLPVTLSDYRVAADDGQAKITWATSWESNNHHFTIERSADGIRFEPLTEVAAQNEPTGSRYAYTDIKPYTGRNYYRLWQTDLDGKKVLLGVRELLLDPGNRDWIFYPNPAKDHIILGLNQQDAGPVTVNIYNAQGKILRSERYTKQAGYWQQRISLSQLTPGIYTIHLRSERFENSRQLIKY